MAKLRVSIKVADIEMKTPLLSKEDGERTKSLSNKTSLLSP